MELLLHLIPLLPDLGGAAGRCCSTPGRVNAQESDLWTTVVSPASEGSDLRCVLCIQPAGAGEGAAGDEDDDEDDEEEAEVAVEEYEDDEDDDDEEDGDEVRCLAVSNLSSPGHRRGP